MGIRWETKKVFEKEQIIFNIELYLYIFLRDEIMNKELKSENKAFVTSYGFFVQKNKQIDFAIDSIVQKSLQNIFFQKILIFYFVELLQHATCLSPGPPQLLSLMHKAVWRSQQRQNYNNCCVHNDIKLYKYIYEIDNSRRDWRNHRCLASDHAQARNPFHSLITSWCSQLWTWYSHSEHDCVWAKFFCDAQKVRWTISFKFRYLSLFLLLSL